MKIGILGSSFNPPHNGHLKISKQAIKIFKLDEVWWMITKQNPLKDTNDYLPFEERIEKINSLIDTQKIKVVHFEDKVQSTYLIDNIKYINQEFSNDSFIFLMGSDSFCEMNKWKNYDEIMHKIPIVIFNRQSSETEIFKLEIAKRYEKFRLNMDTKENIYKKIPSWIFIDDFSENVSSSQLRSN
mgnify:FL=1